MNHIDQEYCKEAGIEIYSLTKDRGLIDYLPSTSELALGLMMSLLRRITQSVDHTRNYEWDYTQFVGRQVDGLKIGIVGFGRLGKMFAKFVRALGAEVYIYDPYEEVAPFLVGSSYKHFTDKWNQVDSLEELFTTCDVISLHVHVSEETKYMIDKKLLAKSKKSPYIINTSRGEIVDEEAIIHALKSNLITGYGADVVEDEFGDLTSSPIIKGMNDGLNIIVTPHTGGMTIEGQTKAYTWAVSKL
jgi:D-3-phosphoglycerate dehydrogenase